MAACGAEPTAFPTAPAQPDITPTAAPASITAATSAAAVSPPPTSTGIASTGPIGPTSAGATTPRTAASPTPSLPPGTPYPASTAGLPPSPSPAGSLKPDQQSLTLAGSEVNSFDPALGSDAGTSLVLRQLYSGLVTLDKNLAVVPDLAERMPDLGDNGTLYIFKLRQGARFRSGREITADDFKYSIERATDPKLAAPEPATSLPATTFMIDILGVKERLEGKTQDIPGVRVKDKYTLEIKLDTPKPQFLAKMTTGVFLVVNREAVVRGFEEVDGSGPFKLAEYRRGQYLRLVRNDNYYLGPPRLSQLNFVLGAAGANSLGLYEQGKLDLTRIGASTDVERALDKGGSLNRELLTKAQLELNYLAFNTKVKPFDDPRVRQAFSIVVDRPRIARAMFESKVQAATGILPPGLPGYNARPGPLGYDINRARDLIAQSSYRSPANLPRITLYSTGDPLGGLLREVYQQAFGIDIEVRQYDFRDFQLGLAQKQFQMYLYGWVADYPDPDNFLRALLGSGSAFNDTGYNNQQFDDLLKQGDQQTDPAKRLDLYSQAEQLALNDAPLLPVYYDVTYMLVKPYVRGLTLTQAGIWTFKDVYILK